MVKRRPCWLRYTLSVKEDISCLLAKAFDLMLVTVTGMLGGYIFHSTKNPATSKRGDAPKHYLSCTEMMRFKIPTWFFKHFNCISCVTPILLIVSFLSVWNKILQWLFPHTHTNTRNIHTCTYMHCYTAICQTFSNKLKNP